MVEDIIPDSLHVEGIDAYCTGNILVKQHGEDAPIHGAMLTGPNCRAAQSEKTDNQSVNLSK